MAGEKPTAGFVLGLIGGILILLCGFFLVTIALAASALQSAMPVPVLFDVGGALMTFALIGVVFGLIVIVGSVMMWIRPQQHLIWGVIVLLFSLFSIVALGGFILGLILGLIGGILGIVFKPAAPMAAPYAPPMAPPPQ